MKKILLVLVHIYCIALFSFAYATEYKLIDFNKKHNSPTYSTLSFQDTLSFPYKQLKDTIGKINIGNQNPKFSGSILVGYKGKLIYEKAFGSSNFSLGTPNSLNTPTQIASISKTFTGSSIVWLQEKGLLNIHDNVQKYFWDFPYSNITIEHLLSHRSGLKDYLDFSGKYWNSSAPMNNQEVFNQFRNYKFKLNFTPGTKFDYCNSNYAILALIIEKVSGMSYKNFIKKYIFEPLNMKHSFVYDPADSYNFNYAKSYKTDLRLWENTHQDGVYGDKGIYTTVEDLYKWDQALYTNKFLSEKSKNDAFTPRSPWNVTKNYGLGWRLRTFPNGEKYVYHTGWWHGYQGILSRYIKDDFTIIILSNRFVHGISKNSELIYEIASNYLSLTKFDEIHKKENEEDETDNNNFYNGISII